MPSNPRMLFFFITKQHRYLLTTTLLRAASSSSSCLSAVAGGSGLELYLRRARLIDSLRLRLLSHDPSAPFPLPSSPIILDSFVAARAIRAAPSPDSAACLFRSLLSLLPPFSHAPHPSVTHSLAKRLSLSRRLPDLFSLLADFRFSHLDRLRLLSTAGDVPSALEAFSCLRSSSSSPDNSRRRRRRCGRHPTHPCTESYNLILGLHASAGDHSSAVATFSQMITDGACPNSRTYTAIIDHLLQANKIDSAMEVFHLLPSMRLRHTIKQYDVLAVALSSSSRFGDLLRLIKEMNSDGILPGRAMLAAIAKIRDAGFINETNEFAHELSPDQRIGYAVDCDEEDESQSEEDESDQREEEKDDGHLQLKPWIDPAALARSLEGWNPTDVAALESADFVWTSRLVCKLLRSFRTTKTAWEFFCWVAYQPGGFLHDRHTVSRMISLLARHGRIDLVDRLLSKLQSERILLPFSTVRLVIDFYGLSKKADAAITIYRRAASICGPLSPLNLMLLSSSLLRTMTKCGRSQDAMNLLEEMMREGILLDTQTFSGLMEHFAGKGDLKSVRRLFAVARQCVLEPDAFMYRVLIRAYCKHDSPANALRMFDEMRSSGWLPDGRTKGILVKSLWKEGRLREAATVEESCEREAELPASLPGHVWTVSAADFDRVCSVYSGCFSRAGGERRCAEGV
ncbi:Pentatricopeptide repeat-containing protein [Apostasia shenzhenica]|uniref:Pentatricopeptide repeat-containing protein n=1 Tax=Apostasia shenzhenica TaxID=1088818 RepID=A0A2I0AV53_9ASPA|nr:Pentatricopeptide repeat-containing protein [Apostasia shenzhenica]